MLVESIVRRTLDLQGFRVETVAYEGCQLWIRLEPDARFSPRCGLCKTRAPYRDRKPDRVFKHVPFWGISVNLVYAPRRVQCPVCDGVRVEFLSWAEGKHRISTALLVVLATWARILSWSEVARLFGFSWGTVAAAVAWAVAYGLARRDLSGVTHIGIDEISRKRGHVYLTQVYDLKTKTLLWSGEGRSKETLETFFIWLGAERVKALQGICCDMWEPYINVIKTQAPQATLVFDKFHIVKHLMEAVDQVRREEIREKGKNCRELLVRSRFIWLKNPWNLTEKQKGRLGFLEKLNLKINRAYLLKESFRGFWDYRFKGWAKKFLAQWFWWATHSRLKPMRNFAWMLKRHKDSILTYFDLPITNSVVEGLNNKAKAISHRSYGYRTARTYITNLYHCMGDLKMPQTTHSFV